MNTDTPETDAHLLGGSYSLDASFARKLERQRNKAIDECIALRQMVCELMDALIPLKAIAEAYDSNGLDDEARKLHGPNYEHINQNPPESIELYCGRGGNQLLTLAHCFTARTFITKANQLLP